MFTVRKSLSALALALTAVATAGAIGTTPASAAGAASSPITTQDSGTHYCDGLTYEGCYSVRADFVRHGYRVGPIYGAPYAYRFDYWD